MNIFIYVIVYIKKEAINMRADRQKDMGRILRKANGAEWSKGRGNMIYIYFNL